ncbi:hypothetical protein BAE44_0020029 [Dichanthelium oligosanthes]|uniref:LysM domain-containing protein n=1 Tax=Dichanthelium oligosanthes TaxID=888268 RepID=A0A1E5V1C7_9POAL|nr:hypothetical protein BAE44_0020029 [Dichanthelium oligosanthes]
MANQRAAALLIASLLVAVALARVDASRHVHARLTVHHDTHGVYAFVNDDAAPVPALSCSQVIGWENGNTCSSVAQGAGLTLDQFLGFNPNINCDKVFIGQWICLAATSA